MVATVLRRRLDATATPAEVLRVFRDQPGLFGLVGEWSGATAIIGFGPARTLAADADPFAAVTQLPGLDDETEGAAAFGGGWVGAFGYQLASRLETLPPSPPRPVRLPDFTLAYYDHAVVQDSEGWWFEALVCDENRARIATRLTAVEGALGRQPLPSAAGYACGDFTSYPDAEGHRAAVAAALRHLEAGDIFQANICRRFEAAFTGDPLDVFCAGIERLAPRYAAFLRTPQGAIASFSPELFLRRQGRSVRTSPIKGTAPLSTDVQELTASAKNRAENVMIVDLMRNDLGRVCTPGSVVVADLARAERHTGVWHLVSDVVGELATGEDDASLLRATYPPGSVTGAPKVRAMGVIHELEATGRETYTGAIGYVSPCAGLELNVAIRTFEFAGGRVWLGVGGGVVIGSTPEGERAETLVKATPLLSAIGASLDAAGDIERAQARTPSGERSIDLTTVEVATALPPVDLEAGVFTTIVVVNGGALDLDRHLRRLADSVADLYGVSLPADLPARVEALAGTLPGRQRLRLTMIPASDAGGRPAIKPVLTTSPLPDRPSEPWQLAPVAMPGGLGPHKYADRRRLDAIGPSAVVWSATRDALLVDRDGSLLETGRGNLFVVTESGVVTPRQDGRLLPGITRQRAIDELAMVGIAVVQRTVTLDDLHGASEVFVTSSLDRIRPVGYVEDVTRCRSGPVTDWLRERLSSAPTRRRSPPRQRGGLEASLLLIDNYDSFVYNLDQYVRELGAHTTVVRNDETSVDGIADAVGRGRIHGIVISPGPGTPADAGVSTEVVQRLGTSVPILGVCLGHQCIAVAYGAVLSKAEPIVHGGQSLICHDGRGVFHGLDGPLLGGRYHSLLVAESSLPPELVATAHTPNGTLMGIRHRDHPVEGIQLHPESILTPRGHHLLATFLRTCVRAHTHSRLGSG